MAKRMPTSLFVKELAAALKTRYGGLVQVEGRENLHKVARSLDLDPQETLLLYQLFGEE